MDLEPEEWALWNSWMQAQRVLAREVDRALQREHGISKAEFSVLVTLHRAAGGQLRVVELAAALDWEKSRVAHLLTRMESRELVERTEAGGRRTGVRLTPAGRRAVRSAIESHAENVRRLFFDPLTPEQAAAIGAWSEEVLARTAAPGEADMSLTDLEISRGGNRD